MQQQTYSITLNGLNRAQVAGVLNWTGDNVKSATTEEEEPENDFGLGEETSSVTITDVIEGFKTMVTSYANAKTGRTAGGKILKKFKVNSVHDLDEDVYEDVIALITKATK